MIIKMKTIKRCILPLIFLLSITNVFAQDEIYSGKKKEVKEKKKEKKQIVSATKTKVVPAFYDEYYTERDYNEKFNKKSVEEERFSREEWSPEGTVEVTTKETYSFEDDEISRREEDPLLFLHVLDVAANTLFFISALCGW